MESLLQLLNSFGKNELNVSDTPYDSAWVARLKDIDADMSNMALEWICEHQLPDGSWGTDFPFYYHDRVTSTLAATIALTYRGRRQSDKTQIAAGIAALNKITQGNVTKRLQLEPAETIGFELIVPTLIAEAESLGLLQIPQERTLSRLAHLRELKMKKLEGIKVSRYTTVAHSAEMTGKDKLDMLDIDQLQEASGSVGNSPAATAHYALYVRPGDQKALDYLRPIVTSHQGGAPTILPFELFEMTWTLWGISHTDLYRTDPAITKACDNLLDYLQESWQPGRGCGFSRLCSMVDGDDTFVTYEVLSKFGRQPDMATILQYEEDNYFRCFDLEVNPSVSANVHALGALQAAGYEKSHPSVQKALRFIRSTRIGNEYWLDKWNLSSYYTTTHLVIAARGYDDELCEEAVKWILKTQHPGGGWGFYGRSTAEETVYCLQALCVWQKHTGKLLKDVIRKATTWLENHCEPPYPPLWIGKSLYSPHSLIKASILSTLALANECM